MLVVIANNIPPAVRGRMKLWFVEARANIFVSGVKDSVAKKVVNYLYKHCPSNSGLIIFQSINRAPWYTIYSLGDTKRNLSESHGLQLVIESCAKTADHII